MSCFLVCSHHIQNLDPFCHINIRVLLAFNSLWSKSRENLLDSTLDIHRLITSLSKSRRSRIRILNSILNVSEVSLEWWMNTSRIFSPFVIHLIKVNRGTSIRKVFAVIWLLENFRFLKEVSVGCLVHWIWHSLNCTTASLLNVSWKEHNY